ncbi:AMIN-like domain-containing (lipo)protein [Nesterenkonia sp. CF4.4]|uniref:AMIN-like domain-containing (lipo)protein n=1 Tax=Nesterenkonia sp. CF4.4 TaxID=3373079 RepID=UPI003EE550A3
MSPRDALLSTAAIAAALALTSCGSAEDEMPHDEPAEQSAEPAEESAEPTESADSDESAEPSDPAEASDPAEPSADEDAGEDEEPAADEDAAEAEGDESEPVDLNGFSTALQSSEDFEDFQLDVGHDTIQVLSALRLGSHEGYERIVLEYALDTDIAHQVQYIEPGSQAEGFTEVQDDLAEAMLLIDVLGTTGGPDAEAAAWTESWTPETEAAMVREIQPGELLGGESQVLISLDEERDFRVQQLDDPVRIVLDIAQD